MDSFNPAYSLEFDHLDKFLDVEGFVTQLSLVTWVASAGRSALILSSLLPDIIILSIQNKELECVQI